MTAPQPFNLKATIESGQPLTFHADYSKSDGSEFLSYVTSSGRVDAAFAGPAMRLLPSSDAVEDVSVRLGMDHDIKRIYKRISTDKFMEEAIRAYEGMRVTRNDPWETTLCFVVSQFNNLKRIRGSVRDMIARFGEVHVTANGTRARLFPNQDSLYNASEKSVFACGTGFRAKYIKSIARSCVENGFEFGPLNRMPYAKAKERLMELDGIGDKVADCILLFAYGKYEAFPIDTWVKRVVENIYFKGETKSVRQIHEFAEQKWGKHAGYAQQYLFWHGRSIA